MQQVTRVQTYFVFDQLLKSKNNFSHCSEAFRGHQILLNHAKNKRKGNTFFSPASREKLKKKLVTKI